jgi:hypothetical protein
MPDDSERSGRTRPGAPVAPILLGGDHRSGTTLVSLILDTHPDVVFGPELDFRLPTDLGAHLVDCCDLELARDPAVAGSGVTTADPRWQLGIQFVRQCRRFGIEVDDLRRLVGAEMEVGARLIDFAERARLIERIGDARREALGVDRWGFKIQRDIVDARTFLAVWPQAVFVHVVRDGRDVAASHLRSARDWAYASAEEAARGWIAVMSGVPRRELGDRLHELRYEDVVCRPEQALRELLEFLGLPWHEGVLHHEAVAHGLARRPFDHPSADAATRAIDAMAIGRYRRDLTAVELTEIEAIAGELLREWGYDAARPESIERAELAMPSAINR